MMKIKCPPLSAMSQKFSLGLRGFARNLNFTHVKKTDDKQSKVVLCQEEFHPRSGGLQLASVAYRFRERDKVFKVQVQEALFTPH